MGLPLMGNGWTDAEREAELLEDTELATRYPNRHRLERTAGCEN